MAFDAVRRRWTGKMDPIQYQRPQEPPALGNIREAEKMVEKLGIVPSLERRPAMLSDVLAFVWHPQQAQDFVDAKAGRDKGGVFDHLKAKAAGRPVKVESVDLPPVNISWEKFQRVVLSGTGLGTTVIGMDVLVPARGPFFGLTTARHADAPPILQWDGLTGTTETYVDHGTDVEVVKALPRNPVSWYFHHPRPPAHLWNLRAGVWAKVTAAFLCPAHWQEPEKFTHFGQMVGFAVEGAYDKRGDVGLALFPETLRGELRPVRAVIEAHSKEGKMWQDESLPEHLRGGDANGIAFQANADWTITLRVTTGSGRAVYVLDRWD
jgi:hypothetical protein